MKWKAGDCRIGKKQQQRLNDKITSKEVRLISENGDQLGVVPIEVALEKDTEFAVTIAPVDALIASTKGGVELSLKFVPVIVTAVCVFSITLGLILPIVGFVSPIVTDPPKDTADPFIVIEEFASFALTTEPFGKVIVPLEASNVAPAGTVIVSPFSPTCNDVPDWGIILSTSIWLILYNY